MKYIFRLKELRLKYNYTQKEISTLLNISLNSYSLYELGKREIPIIILIKLSRIYNTSIDYIVGETNHQKPHKKT